MINSRTIYTAGMVVIGLLLALVSLRYPVINDGPVPPLMSLIALSFIIDFALTSAAGRGQIDPLQMNWRAIGFVAGALVYLGTRLALLPAA